MRISAPARPRRSRRRTCHPVADQEAELAARAPRLTVVVGALPSEDGRQVPLAEDQGAIGEFGPGREHEAFGEACPTTEDRRSLLSAPCTEFSELARLAELADCGVPGTAIRSPVARRGATTPPDGKFGAPLPASSAASADPLARPGTGCSLYAMSLSLRGSRADRQDGGGPDVQAGGRRGARRGREDAGRARRAPRRARTPRVGRGARRVAPERGFLPQPRVGPVDDLLVGHAERSRGALLVIGHGSPRQASSRLGSKPRRPECVRPGQFLRPVTRSALPSTIRQHTAGCRPCR